MPNNVISCNSSFIATLCHNFPLIVRCIRLSTCFFKHKVTSANNDDITYKCIEIWYFSNNIKPNNAVNNIEAYVKIEMSFAGAKLYANVIPICPTAADNPALINI